MKIPAQIECTGCGQHVDLMTWAGCLCDEAEAERAERAIEDEANAR